MRELYPAMTEVLLQEMGVMDYAKLKLDGTVLVERINQKIRVMRSVEMVWT